ncbi:MAG: hypothetical protein R3176_00345 [Woeseiaceae bacterium]|nr:hypothetical protein [Woeseiaceae bacterium]
MKSRLIGPCLLLLAVGVDALACGESLYRVGKGIAYREYTAPLPGNLLVFGAAGDARDLADQLARAGHNVVVAATIEDLVRQAERGEFQVVIGPFSEYAEFKAITVLSEAAYLPIAVEGVDERAAKAEFDQVMVPSKHEIKHYLKAIHRVLKRA